MIISFILITGAALVGLQCSSKKRPSVASQETSKLGRALSKPNDMTQIRVVTNDTTSIELPLSAGNEWYYEVSKDWIISMTEPYGYPSRSSATVEPSSTVKTFLIKGLKKGVVTIRFYLVPLGQTNTTPIQEEFYSIEVMDQ